MKFLAKIAIVGVVLNFADAFATLYEISHSTAQEFNPLLADLDLPSFLLVKFGVALLFGVLAYYSDRWTAKTGIVIGVLTYACVCGYHVFGLLT